MSEMATTSPPQGPRHLTQDDLASRWRISERTLERWNVGAGSGWDRTT
jgi:hypothetical protein